MSLLSRKYMEKVFCFLLTNPALSQGFWSTIEEEHHIPNYSICGILVVAAIYSVFTIKNRLVIQGVVQDSTAFNLTKHILGILVLNVES